MADVEFTKLSSKGQIVIPQSVREELKLDEGTAFAVLAKKDTILLKKIKMPKVKSWEEITKPLKEAAKKAGLMEEEVPIIVHRFRAKRR